MPPLLTGEVVHPVRGATCHPQQAQAGQPQQAAGQPQEADQNLRHLQAQGEVHTLAQGYFG